MLKNILAKAVNTSLLLQLRHTVDIDSYTLVYNWDKTTTLITKIITGNVIEVKAIRTGNIC